MRIEVVKDYESVSRRAEALVVRALRHKPSLLLGVATGETPSRAYERLGTRRAKSPDLFRQLRVVGLDEWMGLPARHPGSCERYIRGRILGPLHVPRSRYRGFRTGSHDPQAEARRMAQWLDREGPLDLCILGLGRNGHLLMNEPAGALRPRAHVARLSASTRTHSMLAGLRRQPHRGLTLGMAEILQSRAILLLVSGRHKRAALARMREGVVSTRCPASLLWLHPKVAVLCDREAAHGRESG